MSDALLTSEERDILAHTLAQFAEHIDSVAVFGSRATGVARPNSDIDLVIYGDLDVKSERRIWTMLEDTSLAIPVDVVVYSRIKNDLLREHIDSVAVPLFAKKYLVREKKKSRGRS